jgi:hypothetical protein
MEHSATGGALSAQTAAQGEHSFIVGTLYGHSFMYDVFDSVCSIGIYLYLPVSLTQTLLPSPDDIWKPTYREILP